MLKRTRTPSQTSSTRIAASTAQMRSTTQFKRSLARPARAGKDRAPISMDPASLSLPPGPGIARRFFNVSSGPRIIVPKISACPYLKPVFQIEPKEEAWRGLK